MKGNGGQSVTITSVRTVAMLYAGNLAVATLFLSLDGLTLAVAQKTSIWMMSSVKELNLTFGTVLMLAGTHMTVDTMRMLESSVQVKKTKQTHQKNYALLIIYLDFPVDRKCKKQSLEIRLELNCVHVEAPCV